MRKLQTVANIEDLRTLARRTLPRHFFDFIDGAAFREKTKQANIEDLDRLRFRQRVLRDVSRVDISTTLVGQPAAMPVAIAPTGISGILAGGGRGEILAARAAKAAGVPFTLGMVALSSIEDVCAAAEPPWFQLCMLTDRELVRAMVKRAELAGCPVLVLTTTWPYYSQHDRLTHNPNWSVPPRLTPGALLAYAAHPAWSLRTLFGRPVKFRNFEAHRPGRADIGTIVGLLDASTQWKDVQWLRDIWPGKLVVKGITEPDDAELAVRFGIDAISVSNHGGNQLDEATSTISMLPDVVAAVGGRIDVLIDGGFRSGQDVLKALALGARGCLLGRAHLYGLAAAGEAGVAKALEVIRTQLAITTGLVGLSNVRQASPAILAPSHEPGVDRPPATASAPNVKAGKRYKFVALVNIKPGADQIFNEWHTGTHLPQVVKAAGFTRGERMKLVAGSNGENTAYEYLVVFDGEGEHPLEALQKLGAAVEAGEVEMSDTLGAPIWSSLYEEIPGAVYTR